MAGSAYTLFMPNWKTLNLSQNFGSIIYKRQSFTLDIVLPLIVEIKVMPMLFRMKNINIIWLCLLLSSS